MNWLRNWWATLFGGSSSPNSRPAAGTPSEGRARPLPSGAPSWILIEGSNPAVVEAATLEHAGLARHEVPTTHRGSLVQLNDGRFGLFFEPPLPAYAFTNLIGWLADPNYNEGVRRAVGWLVSPASGIRYYLSPRANDQAGDTLDGMSSDGQRVSLFLPDGTLTVAPNRLQVEAEPSLPAGGSHLRQFAVTVDSDPSFGNPEFVVS